MPMVTTFDTHKFVTKLEEAGLPKKQAEAITEALQETQRDINFATKQDVELAKLELKKDLSEVKSELVRWVVGAGFLQTALIAALLMKLIN